MPSSLRKAASKALTPKKAKKPADTSARRLKVKAGARKAARKASRLR